MGTFALHNLRPAAGATKNSKRLGRGTGSGRGTTAGKGSKGQRARQGGRKGLRALGMKYLIQATPKLGGFASLNKKPVTIQVAALNCFKDGQTVSLKTLVGAGLIRRFAVAAKVIGNGKVRSKLIVKKIAATVSAKKAIEAAGGTIQA